MLRPMQRAPLTLLLIASAAACQQAKPSTDNAAPSASAPSAANPLATPSSGNATLAGEIAELGASANRKMLHDDGKGCLEDLDKLKAHAPKLAKTMSALRAQCQMLAGDCQAGKKLLAGYYVRQMNMAPDRAHRTAESIGSMRCRGTDMTERDKLLRALWEISDGAFMNSRKDCDKNIALVRQLSAKVKPNGPDDGQVKGGPRALFHNGAACLARAKDCAGAWRVWQENYPGDALSKLSETQRREVMAKGFRSSIERCKDHVLGDVAGGSPKAPPKSAPKLGGAPLIMRK